MARRWHSLAMGLGLLVALVLPAGVLADGATLVATAPSVSAGHGLAFSGSGFRSGERVGTWATAPDQSVRNGPFFSAAADGSVAITFTLPGDALSGRWALTAHGDHSKLLAVATFDVNGANPSQAPPQASVDPPAGSVGTVFTFVAFGYKSNEQVSYWITGPNGAIFAAYPKGDDADKHGKLHFRWTAPANAPRGTWVMTMQGYTSGTARGVRFEIQ